jgi:hypothetical protein
MKTISWYTPNGQTNIRRAYVADAPETEILEVSANVDKHGRVLDWRWRLLGAFEEAKPSEGGTEEDEEHAKSSAEVAYRQAAS